MKDFRARLANRHMVTAHLTVILFILTVFGVLLSQALLALGITDLIGRTALVIPLSYVFFFLLVHFWIRYVFEKTVSERVAEEDLVEDIKSESASSDKPSKGDWLSLIPDFGEGGIFLAGFVVIIFSTVWIIVEGPLILTEAAFEVALAASLAKALLRNREAWHERLLKRTAVAFILFWIISVVAVSFMSQVCPGHSRISEIVKACLVK